MEGKCLCEAFGVARVCPAEFGTGGNESIIIGVSGNELETVGVVGSLDAGGAGRGLSEY